MSKEKVYDILEVTWTDAEEVGDVGWNDLKKQLREAKKPCTVMKSVGYCVYRSDTHISLISTMGTDLASTLEKIPMSFVVSVKTLVRI
tara:strand:+ start:107 stop:370 length:264 start_codon:yes stop_codon:yes gene_type:complete